jgi:excisionase family DNA binding protein
MKQFEKGLNMEKLKLLTPSEVSAILGVEVETLNVWRCTKRYNLNYVKTGRLVRYRLEDVQKFIEGNLVAVHA